MEENQNMRRYELTDREGNVLTTFTFDLYGSVKWFAENAEEFRKSIIKLVGRFGNIDPDGKGLTWMDEQRLLSAERFVKKSFSKYPGNVEEAFFTIRRPFASVGGEFYLTHVMRSICSILSAELEKSRT